MKVGGKTKMLSDNPIVDAYLKAQKLLKARKSDKWRMAEAAVTDKRMLVGSGNLAKDFPEHLPSWLTSAAAETKGKPMTRKQKRAFKRHKAQIKGE